MRGSELLRLVWLNLIQNKFKTIMTSIGIIVGAATIVMVIGIGRGGQMDVAEQFSSLNAGAIDITYEWEGEESGSGFSFGGFDLGNVASMFGFGQSSRGGRSSGNSSADNASGGGFSGGMPGGGQMMQGGGQMTMPGGSSDGSTGGFSMPDGASGNMPDMSQVGGGNMPDMSQMGNGEMPDMSNMEMPEDFESMMPGGSGDGTDGESRSGNRSGDSEDAEAGGAADDADVDGEADVRGADGGAGADVRGADGSADAEGDMAEAQSDFEDMENAGASSDAAAEGETEEISSIADERLNQENIILSVEDVEDIELFVSGITGATISYSTRSSVEGGNLTDAQTYTIAGVIENYASLSNLNLADGYFLTEDDNDSKSRVCVLGASVAKELFGSTADAYESTIYIDDRAYTICGVLATSSTVSAGISPDEAIFIPYETGIKYITGENISPTLTVIAEDVNALDNVISDVKTILAENYNNAEFTFADAGSKMEAAESSNQILTLLLAAMAVIVFIVGGIGIMNVLFVSVKERTGEIGILKSLGASRSIILLEFLLEAAATSLLGGVLGVGASFLVTPVVEYFGMRVEANMIAWASALGFAVLTGTLFGFYPAWQASKLVPVEALNAE